MDQLFILHGRQGIKGLRVSISLLISGEIGRSSPASISSPSLFMATLSAQHSGLWPVAPIPVPNRRFRARARGQGCALGSPGVCASHVKGGMHIPEHPRLVLSFLIRHGAGISICTICTDAAGQDAPALVASV